MSRPYSILAVLVIAGTASGPVRAAPPAISPFLGLWTLDTGAMSVPVDARPASVTAEFADAGAGAWNTTYVITAKDGRARRMISRERLDGQAVPIAGDQADYDSVAMTSPLPEVLVMGLSKRGHLASVRVYIIAPGSREMIEHATVVTENGTPAIRRFRWVR